MGGWRKARLSHRAWAGAVVMLILMTTLSLIQANDAAAGLYGPIPANEEGDPTDEFVDDNALYVYVRSDIQGGRICVVENTDDVGAVSCERPAWGTPNTIVSIGTTYALLEAPSLVPGTWRLLAENSEGTPTELSIPFTVRPRQS